MNIIRSGNSEMEVYSIDEAFVTINPRYTNPIDYYNRNKNLSMDGIPVSIGIGKTKTLVKSSQPFI